MQLWYRLRPVVLSSSLDPLVVGLHGLWGSAAGGGENFYHFAGLFYVGGPVFLKLTIGSIYYNGYFDTILAVEY